MKSRVIALVVALSAGSPPAPHPPTSRADDGPAAEAAKAAGMTAEERKRWSIRVGDGEGRPATIGPDPVLRYTNPGVGRVHGGVFLCIVDGRPGAVLTIYKWFTPYTGFEAELQSLSTSAVRGHRDGQVAWRSDGPGIAMADVPEAPPPAPSAVERLGQMRSIAGDFSGRLLDGRTAATGVGQALRLLPKPLYRHEARDPGLLDGGLFAFVLGTDPEVFLLLEARQAARGPRWRYGLARMNSDPLRVTHRGQEVWKVEKVADRHDPRSPYLSVELPQKPYRPGSPSGDRLGGGEGERAE